MPHLSLDISLSVLGWCAPRRDGVDDLPVDQNITVPIKMRFQIRQRVRLYERADDTLRFDPPSLDEPALRSPNG